MTSLTLNSLKSLIAFAFTATMLSAEKLKSLQLHLQVN